MSVLLLRRVVLATALVALVAAVLGGLGRLGLVMPPSTWVERHGAGMVGFLGVVVAVERAFLLGSPGAHLVPLLGVAGLAALLGGAPGHLGHGLLASAGLGLVALQATFLRRRPSTDNVLMVAGALAWVFGQVVVLTGGSFGRAAPAWASFVVLVIVGERLELVRREEGRPRALVLAAWATLVAHAVALAAYVVSARVGGVTLGVGWCLVGLVLLRADPALRARTEPGLDRYVATGLRSGFVWLVVAGVLTASFSDVEAGPFYDARLHALFGGFGLTLLFAHGPEVLPALAGREGHAWSRAAWGALVVLQVAATGRVLADLRAPALRGACTTLHALALAAFVLAMARGLLRLTPARAVRF